MRFDEMFERAAGHGPYPFQTLLAEANELPQLLDIPGILADAMTNSQCPIVKDAVSAIDHRSSAIRRRRCLPMRVLMEHRRLHDMEVTSAWIWRQRFCY